MTTALPGLPTVVVERVLALSDTWLRWDGAPKVSEDGDRVYTPHKAVRRVADHFIDHLAEIEALIAGDECLDDHWHGSLVTTHADLAPYTEVDRDETRQRLLRIAQLYRVRLSSLGPQEWDRERPGHMTIRQIVEHVADPWYAEQVGDLSPGAASIGT
jgi:hypothetical protein